METENHRVLKIKALEWLYVSKKCKWVATEIKVGRYIYDVVGCDGNKIYIIEAKQSHADFSRDCNSATMIRDTIKVMKKDLKENGNVAALDGIRKEREKSTKFFDESIFRLASETYIIAPSGLIDKKDLPPQWGLLNEDLRILEKCETRKINKSWIIQIISTIAIKQTKIYLSEIVGVKFGKTIDFPQVYLSDNCTEDYDEGEDNEVPESD